MTLEDTYRERRDKVLMPIAAALEAHVIELFKDGPRIDRITARAKQVDSFIKKSEKLDQSGNKKIHRAVRTNTRSNRRTNYYILSLRCR